MCPTTPSPLCIRFKTKYVYSSLWSRFHTSSGRKQVIPIWCDDHLVLNMAKNIEGASTASLTQVKADCILKETSPGSHSNIHHLKWKLSMSRMGFPLNDPTWSSPNNNWQAPLRRICNFPKRPCKKLCSKLVLRLLWDNWWSPPQGKLGHSHTPHPLFLQPALDNSQSPK